MSSKTTILTLLKLLKPVKSDGKSIVDSGSLDITSGSRLKWPFMPKQGPRSSTVLYSTAQYCTLLYSTVQYCTVLYSTAQYCTVLFFSTTTIFFLPSLFFSSTHPQMWQKKI